MTGMLAQTMFAQTTFEGPPIDWWALTPLLVLAGGGLALLVIAALTPSWPRGLYAAATVTTASAALVVALIQWYEIQDDGPRSLVGGAMSFDGFASFVTVLICATVILTALVADDYLRRVGLEGPEIYGLVLMAAVGGVVMAGATDLIVLFLGLETLSLALYVLAGSQLRRLESQESAMKYFVLGGFSSAFFLYGVAMVYGATGSTNMAQIFDYLSSTVLLEDRLLLAGLALLLVGLGFKVAAVPFHFWTPDVYQGAPSPVTGFMASAAKAAGFAALLRVFVVAMQTYEQDWQPAVLALTVATLVVGSVLAIVQTNVKRMLAYSSVSHAGFILIGVEVATARGTSGSLVYLLAYAVIVIGTFAVVGVVGRSADGDQSLESYRGLSQRRPVLALVFTVLLLAQAGVPLTSGFIAKFGVISAAAADEEYLLAVAAMLTAVIAAFIYLRIVVSMYLADPTPEQTEQPVRIPLSAGLAIGLSVAFTIVVGIVPGFIVDFADGSVPVLAGRVGG